MVLLIPQPAGASVEDVVATNRSQWLMLDKSYISTDGSQCNKVGTSFEGFRYQTEGCFRAPQASARSR